MFTVENIWNKLFNYWSLHEFNFQGCKGATEDEIENMESSLKLTLPRSLKDSLKICNNYPDKFEKSSCLFIGAGGKLLCTKEIVKSYKEMNLYKFFDGEALPYENIDPKLGLNFTWSKYLVPIFSWNCNEIALIDLHPESKNYGQILYEDIEFGTVGIWEKSYESFLSSIANAILDHGSFCYNDMKEIRKKIKNDRGLI